MCSSSLSCICCIHYCLDAQLLTHFLSKNNGLHLHACQAAAAVLLQIYLVINTVQMLDDSRKYQHVAAVLWQLLRSWQQPDYCIGASLTVAICSCFAVAIAGHKRRTIVALELQAPNLVPVVR